MELSSFSTLSVEDQRQAIEDLVIESNRKNAQEHLGLGQAVCKEHATATLAQEEAEREENTQAQDEEPKSFETSTRADLVQVLVKKIFRLQQQAASSCEEAERVGRVLIRHLLSGFPLRQPLKLVEVSR